MEQERIDRVHELQGTGELFTFDDPDFFAFEHECIDLMNEFNATPETSEGLKRREEILRETMGTYGENIYIVPPIYTNNGLRFVHAGKNVAINFCAKFIDFADIYIGDNVMFGPDVTVITGTHPVSPRLREVKLQYDLPVRIGNNVWVGAGAKIMPGVTIGDNAIVGSGSVVTKDVPENTIVVGNPARVLREIDDNDDVYFDHDRKIPDDIVEKYLG